MKVVINRCHGGFGLSKEAQEEYAKRKGIDPGLHTKYGYENIIDHEINRSDEDLVSIVESMGETANGWAAELAVVEIPDEIEWTIEDYDGLEWVAEFHRTWR